MPRSLTQIVKIIKKAHGELESCVGELATKFRGKSREQIKAALLPVMPSVYKVKLVDGDGKAKGRKVLDSESPEYEAARKMVQRIVNAIAPTTKPESNKRIVLPNGLRQSIVDQIIDAGLTKTQFDALLSQVRDSVSFK